MDNLDDPRITGGKFTKANEYPHWDTTIIQFLSDYMKKVWEVCYDNQEDRRCLSQK